MNLDNSTEAPAERILFRLKTVGPQSTASLADSLGLTTEAVRQQVQKLQEANLIAGEAERAGGAGRPRQVWALTAAGHARFPDTHAQLAVDLIGSMRQLFGDAGVERLIDARREDNRQAYLSHLKGARTIGERVQRLAEIRQREGYMASARADGADWLLMEDHCPICAAARACQGFCRAELLLFQDVLGPDVQVVREQHLLAGARRCSYRISPRR